MLAAAAMLALGTVPAALASGAPEVEASDFVLPSTAEQNVRLSEFLGQPVVLSFWSSGCSLCARQLQQLRALNATYRAAGLVVLAISVDDNLHHAQEYARSHDGGFPMLLDAKKSVSRAYAIDQLPTTVLIDRFGQLRYRHTDYNPAEQRLVAEVRQLIDETVAGTPPNSAPSSP